MSGFRSNLKLGAIIGNGHFGVVHLGTDEVHGEVAVKVLQQRPGETPLEWQARKAGLLAEGQSLKQATHANVVQVFQLLEADGLDGIFLVMEYCSGGSLQKKFEKNPLSLFSVRKLATDVSFGLHALHARGMIHRDIKPGNILLGGTGVAKLGDFGLVTDNIVLGYASTAGYSDHIAPEVWNGAGTSVRSDIWALGMTVYRLLHGKEWYSSGPAPTRAAVENGGFADRLRWLPHISKKWRRVIRKMLSDDPHSRYADANQFISALGPLPIEPRWSCAVSGPEVNWKRQANGRRVLVNWKKQTPRSCEWSAWSEPIGAGRRRTLGGATGVGYAASNSGLRAFFADQEE